MKTLIALFAITMAASANANLTDGVPVLGETFTDTEEALVRAGSKAACEIHDEFEDREQCAMDYFAEHNYQGEPECDE